MPWSKKTFVYKQYKIVQGTDGGTDIYDVGSMSPIGDIVPRGHDRREALVVLKSVRQSVGGLEVLIEPSDAFRALFNTKQLQNL